LESDQNQGDGELSVFVEDRNGNDLQDARVRVENGETEVEYTDSNGKADFFLEEGWYDVTVSKSGYETETRDVRVNEDEETVIRLGLDSSDSTGDNGDEAGLDITDVDYPNSVCEGGSFTADITIENRGGFHEVVTVSGSGLGSITIGNSFTMEEGDTKTRSLRFTNVEGTGTEQFDITATNHDSDSTSRSIKVRDCPVDASREPVQEDTETFQASGMTMQLEPDRVRIGEALKVSGYVDGARGRSKVRITINGDDAGRVNTQPDGYFQTFIRPESVGELTVTATAGSARNSRKLEVLPTANVVYAQSPQKVFEGEQFEVCGQVESQVTPTVYLEKDDQIVASKNAKGEVCFQRNATGAGDHRYDVIALARGAKNVATTNTEVLEAGSETESFPDKVVSVESGSGLVKVELYNTHNELRRYHLSLEEVPDSWVSQSEKEVLLSKGERKTVYFYLTPKDEGDFTGQLKVETGGSTIFQEDIRINSGGTTEPQGGFLQGLLEGLGLRL
ncbi:MAG: carboxypeptidase regulatory-like domain-containing protein, partial [Candidatus Nanohaloarchaea archaeon]